MVLSTYVPTRIQASKLSLRTNPNTSWVKKIQEPRFIRTDRLSSFSPSKGQQRRGGALQFKLSVRNAELTDGT